jgi:hypothetical protein
MVQRGNRRGSGSAINSNTFSPLKDLDGARSLCAVLAILYDVHADDNK